MPPKGQQVGVLQRLGEAVAELRTGKGFQAEGLPATFRNFTRHLGGKVLQVEAGPVDTGDLIEAR